MGSISGSGVVCRLDRGDDVAVSQILEFWTTGIAILDDGAASGVFLGLAKERDRRSRADASRSISSGSSNQNGFAFGPCTPRMLLLEVVRRESLDSVACILWLLESASSWSPCSLTSSTSGRSPVRMEFLTVDAGCLNTTFGWKALVSCGLSIARGRSVFACSNGDVGGGVPIRTVLFLDPRNSVLAFSESIHLFCSSSPGTISCRVGFWTGRLEAKSKRSSGSHL